MINDTEIRELDVGKTYTYLGIDESIGMNGELNKDKVNPILPGGGGGKIRLPSCFSSTILKRLKVSS